MAVGTTISVVLHLLAAGLWTGGVVFFVWRVHPLVVDGNLEPDPAGSLVSGLQWLSRASALLLLATGGHLYAVRYAGSGGLFSSTRGWLVAAMVVLWIVLAAVVEAGSGRLAGELDEGRVRTGGRESRRSFVLAAIVAVTVLAVGGWLAV